MASSRNSGSAEALLDAVAASLQRHLQPRQTLVVAFSGGRDSLALLDALQSLQGSLSFALSASHVNHHLSPQAGQWEAFCQRYCVEAGIPLTVHHVEVPRGSPEGLEAAARECRYQALASSDPDWLAVGHHSGDQAETLMFNLLRGAGLSGAAGMPEARPLQGGVSLLRPLLTVPRAAIEAYLESRQLTWVDDESNHDTAFSRNFLRHEVLPLLAARFPAAEQKLAEAAARFAEAGALLDELALSDLAGQSPRFPLPVACLLGLSEARGRNVLRFLLAQHGVQIPSEQRLIEALRQLRQAGPDRHPAIAFGEHRITRLRGVVYLDWAPPKSPEPSRKLR
ncbi:MAG TPA: tRNA lysidine(34) synthetase TilS [Rhodocyclaceae bacterium]|nr:tRNA lysidine(34) synthetase TilS [Rhodocyclaceae bacterium]